MMPIDERWIRLHPKSDDELFERMLASMPKRGDGTSRDGTVIPFTSSPTCIQFFRRAIELARPLKVLEIGTNIGYSSWIMLTLGVPFVLSIDNTERPETDDAVKALKSIFGTRFEFVRCHSHHVHQHAHSMRFDMAFIDGGHDFASVLGDIDSALSLGCRWLLFDDFFENHGPGVIPAIQERKLTVVAIIGSMALAEPVDENWSDVHS